jgi:hypothetical protein
MARKKQSVPSGPRPNDNWVIETEIQINGRNVVPGTELKIEGERGRFLFMRYVVNGEISWIDVHGGPKGYEHTRSFRLDRVKRVHYKNQSTKNLAKEYKEKLKAKRDESPDAV